MPKLRDRVAIVVDSAASLPKDIVEDVHMYIVPMRITFQDRTYLDGQDILPGEFYQLLERINERPITSAPSPKSFLDAFRAASKISSSVVCITVSRRFSSSYYSANSAVIEAMREMPDTRFVVIDSDSAAGGQGLIASEAWRVSRDGAEFDQVILAIQRVVSSVFLLAFLDTLYYVWKSGRVPRIGHVSTSILKIKPLFKLSNGEIQNCGVSRTRRKAEDRMLELMDQLVGRGAIHVSIMHANVVREAEKLMNRIETKLQCEELFVSEFSTVMGSHTGPGLLAIAFWCEI